MINRRKFLQQTAAGVAGLTVSQYAFSNIHVPQKKEKLGVALVGLGYYSTDLLAPALQLTQKCSLAGIVTGTPAKAEKWKQQHNIPDKNIYNYQNFDSIANNPDIDVIYIVLPPSMHAEYSIRAAKAGKHVWCEKPMAMTEAECKSMIDAAKKNKVTLAIGYRLHHEPNTQRIIQIRKDLVYGKVLSTSAAAGYRDNRTDHWKQKKSLGGGAMYDMGVYSLNAARYATGLEPIAVSAKGSTTRPEIYKEVEETMNFDLEFPGGVTAKCETTFGRGVNTLETKFANGWYKLEPFQQYSGQRGITSDGKVLDAVIPNQQAKQMDDDATSILNGTPLLVPGEEGMKDIKVVEAIYKSAASQGARVKV
ncbi:Gfo/Idh/MocA family oxidoreductase [Chryseolinea sp. H1M3-3]|jgi:glucose-fructose oxidoreductase|uniref:Gfo/Idh/MocA family protein n=1 Tax=Chryseolinea sp. H1M3-3 TaxID=3034144 RepID=UPI0023ED0937|nr:Gfo/Idh/MocA family oxidoreductase [Chryseolinea sp. H1M3-3]